MRTIAVVNQKGGCGKTTVSINLASALAEASRKTLLVDMDPQSHCAVGLAVPEDQIEQSIYDVLISRSRNEPIKLTEILWRINDRLELAPASIDLSAFEQQMAGIAERECCLRDALTELKNDYEYAIIDCPPAVGLLTFSALRAATDVIVPVETGYFALHGLSRQLETLSILCERCSHQVAVRVLASMYDIRTKMAREILAELRKHFEDKMFTTIVNFNTKIKEAASLGQPINEYDPASKGQKDFHSLAEEIAGSAAKPQPHEFVNSLATQLEAISATADELLEAASPTIEAVQTSRTEQSEPLDIDAKLSDYYGVSQVDGAVVLVTLYPRADAVQLAGDFNNWQPTETPMQKVSGSRTPTTSGPN
jgi:chromosome partitioning protein